MSGSLHSVAKHTLRKASHHNQEKISYFSDSVFHRLISKNSHLNNKPLCLIVSYLGLNFFHQEPVFSMNYGILPPHFLNVNGVETKYLNNPRFETQSVVIRRFPP